MTCIITAIISAMIGGTVGLFVGCACAAARREEECTRCERGRQNEIR